MKTSELPTIDYRKVEPIQGNLKQLSKDNFEKLKKVLEKRGFDIPIFVWNGFILDGHQRVRVAQEIDLKPYEVPYIEIEAKDQNEAKKRVLEISSQYGTITQEGYDEFTADLPESELLETVNFDALSWSTEEEVEEDEPPEVSKEPAKSKLGEIYQLGRHRLMCGDANKDIAELMDGKKADMVFTDPPYGMDVDTGYDQMFSKDKAHKKTGERFDKVIGDDSYFDPSPFLGLANEVIMWGADYYCQSLPLGGSWFVWDKRVDENMDKVVGNTFELCWSKKPHKREVARILWSGHHGMSDDDTKERVHPTQKPVKVITWVLTRVDGEIVLDPFGGSGSTLIACEQLDRTCYMMELDPRYTDVIRKRWVKLVHPDQEDDWEKLTPKV